VKKKKLLIIGGSGFVGINLIKKLRTRYKIIATFFKSKPKRFKYVQWVKLDFSKESSKIYKNNFYAIIHLATQKHLVSSSKALSAEISFFKKIVNYCEKKKSYFIFLSTTLIYKKLHNNNENSKLISFHRNKYINSKIMFDNILSKKFHNKFKLFMLRVPSIFSDKIKKINFVKQNLNKIKNNIKIIFYRPINYSVRYVYVSDIVKIITQFLVSKKIGIYNLERNESVSLYKILLSLKKRFNLNSQIEIINKKNSITNLKFRTIKTSKIKKNFKIYTKGNFFNQLRAIQ
jgi:dTDP-4-dehydrorhamnose reductase